MKKLEEINEKLGYIDYYGLDWDLKYYQDKKEERERKPIRKVINYLIEKFK